MVNYKHNILIFMKILNTIKSSIYNPVFYSSIKDSTTKSAFIYYTKLNLLVAIFIVFFISIIAIPSFLSVTKLSNIESFLSTFPKDFEIVIKDGSAFSNINESYDVPVPVNLFDKKSNFENKFDNILTVDTNSEFSLDKFKNSQSMFYLSKDYLAFEDERGKINIESIKGLPDFVINQSIILTKLDKVLIYINILAISIFVILGYFMIFVFLFVSNLIFISIMSLIIMLILKLKKLPALYGDIFKNGLYVITTIILLEMSIQYILGISIPIYVSFIIYLFLYYSNTRKIITK